MTVETVYAPHSYKPGSAGAAEAIPFEYKANSDLIVTHVADDDGARTVLAPGTHFTVGGSGPAGSGTITAIGIWPADDLFVIERDTDNRQSANYPAHEALRASEFQGDIDRLTLVTQEADERVGRAIVVPPGLQGSMIDDPAQNVGKFIAAAIDGKLIWASGTGSDAGLRADLGSADAYDLVFGYEDLLSTVSSLALTLANLPVRERIVGIRDYYVRTNGSDSNNGLSNTPGGAFLTVQKAVDTAYNRLDLGGYNVVIHVADGVYTGPVKLAGSMSGGFSKSAPPIRIVGNEAAPGSVVFQVTGDDCVAVTNQAHLAIAGVQLRTISTGRGLFIDNGAIVEAQYVSFGNIHHEMLLLAHAAAFRATGPLFMSGNAESWVHATGNSLVDMSSVSLTFNNNNFSVYAIGLNAAVMKLDSATGLGTKIATGQVLVHDSAQLNVSSYSGVPWWGNTAPVVDQGGVIQDNLLENRTLYVRSSAVGDIGTGMVNNDAYAFKTIQAAVNWLSRQPYDRAYWTNISDLSSGWTIQIADGTYAETVNLKDVHALGATIIGNSSNSAAVQVQGVTDTFVAVGLNTKWSLRYMGLSATNGNVIRAERGSQIAYRAITFGTAQSAHVSATSMARVFADGNYTINGNAAFHFFTHSHGLIDFTGAAVTVSGNPAFSAATAYAESHGCIRATGASFSGSATGKRYDVRTNAVIDINGGGTSFFPGSTAGSTASGGEYA